ncbi:hypothetical protein ACSBR1_007824 [Camellia fascicularis]
MVGTHDTVECGSTLHMAKLCKLTKQHFQMPIMRGCTQAATSLPARNETDQLALLAFKSQITDDPFNLFSSWNESIHFCQWRGITCDLHHQRVVMLDLHSQKLAGNISSYIGNLSFLTALSLQTIASLTGSFPDAFGRLTNLKIIALAENRFSRTIPASIFNLSTIRVFDVGGNQLKGSLPSDIGNALPNLEYFSFNRNHFNRSIPISIFNASNKLTGGVPILEKLHKIHRFSVGSNQLGSGHRKCSSSVDSREFGPEALVNSGVAHRRDSTSALWIQRWGRQFRGEDRDSIPSGIGNLINLERIWLFGNQCIGNVPFDTGKLQNLRDLDFSEINSQEISHRHLDLSQNSLTSSLPMEVGNLKNLGYLNVSNNMLSGEIPATLGSCVMLETLCMDDNLFQGTIPSTLASLRGIQFLDLSSNNLSGRIPKYFASFNLLQNLNLFFNDFEGAVANKGIIANASAISVMGNKKLCGGLTFLLCIPYIYWYRKTDKDFSLVPLQTTFLKVSYQTLLKATEGFSSANLIGAGSFGSVYKGLLENDRSIVAVKVVNLQRHGASKSFIAECEALRNIKHRNLVKFKHTFASKTPNIKQGSSIGVIGTTGYTTQEYGMGSEVTTKGDVYSCGILLLEMFTGKRPTDDTFEDSLNLHNFVKMALPNRVTEVADPMLLRGEEENASDFSEITRDCLILILQIGFTCSSGLPKEQMNISDVL